MFDDIFNFINAKEVERDSETINEFLGLVIENVSNMTITAMITCVRLTYLQRGFLSNWKLAVYAIRDELIVRGKDADVILCGLL